MPLPSPLDIAPLHDIPGTPGMPWGAEPIGFTSDNLLVVENFYQYLDVWSLIVHFWPEIFGAFVGLAALILVIALIRVKRRPQTIGAPHCRRCNYLLVGVPAGQPCPECGTDPARRRPVPGRSTLRRVAVPLTVLVLLAAGYGALRAIGVRRENAATYWFSWPSSGLADYAQRNNIAWLKRHERPWRWISVIDPASGQTVRTLRQIARLSIPSRGHSMSRDSSFRTSISPDGRTAVFSDGAGDMAAIDLRTGRIRARREALSAAPSAAIARVGPSGWCNVAGWTDPGTVYVQHADATTDVVSLHRWTIATDTLTPIPDPAPAAASAIAPAAPLTGFGELVVVPGSNPPQALEVPLRRTTSSYAAASTLRVRDLADGRVVRELTDTFWAGVLPVPREDGSFFIRNWGGADDILLWSIAGSGREGGLKAPGFMGTLQQGPSGLAWNPATQRLFVATTGPDAVHVRDTAAKAWIARLSFKRAGALPNDYPIVSPDGRWLAIAVTDTGPRTPGLNNALSFVPHLLIFDLQPLNAAPIKTAPVAPSLEKK